ncbi:MAG: DUF2298 domain-containing protein, partial [Chloroflexota bacterium]
LYQSTQWVKMTRYLLPIYSLLVIMAAYLVAEMWHWRNRTGLATLHFDSDMERPNSRTVSVITRLIALAIMLTSITYAVVFSGIYRESLTRVKASRWIYSNVPTGAALAFEIDGEIHEINVPIHSGTLNKNGQKQTADIDLPASANLLYARLNHLSDPENDSQPEQVSIKISRFHNGGGEIASAILVQNLEQSTTIRGDSYSINLDSALVPESGSYFFHLMATDGAPVRTEGSTIINETAWDDAMPWRLNGLDGFSIYQGGSLELYWDDNIDKSTRIARLLDSGDYLVVSSTRQLGSITRLPPRYPLTMAYYEALFAGDLGYELVKTFVHDFRVGPLVLNDVYGKVGWNESPEIGWPPPGPLAAEEAFSVYDHPPVWIFAKSQDYTPSQVRAVLDQIDLSQQRFVIPFDYTNELWVQKLPVFLSQQFGFTEESSESDALLDTNGMLLDNKRWEQQKTQGTWGTLYNEMSTLNRLPAFGAAAWWLWLFMVGLAAFPITFIVCRGFSTGGYLSAKLLGLIIVSWLAWYASSIEILPFSGSTIWLSALVLMVIGFVLYMINRESINSHIRSNWRVILIAELLGTTLFIAALMIRCGNPDLWHPIFGGEKPMDFAFLNAVAKSNTFPPYDPWLAGAYQNYYYFGHVMVSSVMLPLKVVPAVAYNIALAMFVYLIGTSAFGAATTLFESTRRSLFDEGNKARTSQLIMAGTAAALLAVVLGNLGQLILIGRGLMRLGGEGLWIIRLVRGLVEVVSGASLPVYLGSWYWDATRIIPAGPGEAGPITEFPFFSFLYGDLHAHLMNMPLVISIVHWSTAIIALPILVRRRLGDGIKLAWIPAIFIASLSLGLIRATNSWDYPIAAILIVSALAVAMSLSKGKAIHRLVVFIIVSAVVLILSNISIAPFLRHFQPAYTDIQIWRGSTSPIWAYLLVFGLFLFILLPALFIAYREQAKAIDRSNASPIKMRTVAVAAALVWVLASTILLSIGVKIAPLVLVIAIAAGLLALYPSDRVGVRIAMGLLAGCLVVSLGVEVIVLSGDISRMNTVFKFYSQIWMLLSVAAGAVLPFVNRELRGINRSAFRIWIV